MTTIAEFLEARWAETEAIARAAVEFAPGRATAWTYEYAPFCDEPYWTIGTEHGADHIVGGGYEGGGAEAEEYARHIALHDPERELKVIEANRAILAEHTCPTHDNCEWCLACSGNNGVDPTPAPCPTLKAMTIPYTGHPDYQQEWAL